MRTTEFFERVEARAAGGLSREDAKRATRATLQTLAARISAREASALGAQLPRELAGALRTRAATERFSSMEFLDRVAARGDVSRSEALDRVRAVMNVLAEAVSPAELAHVRAELPSDYELLFAPPAVVGWPDAHIAATHPPRETHPRPGGFAREAAPRKPEGRALNVDVAARGPVAQSALDDARRKVGELRHLVDGPVLGARVVLTQEQNPRLARPARAEGEIDLPGVQVRARAAAASMPSAVDELAERLQRRLRDRIEMIITGQRMRAEPRPGEWFHGAMPTARPEHRTRPPGEREVVRRKSFGVEAMDAAEAAASMDALDHHFYLFHDMETDADAVIYRRDDGQLAVIEPAGTSPPAPDGPAWETSRISSPIELEDAVREMDALDHRFLFFVNARTGRGNVIYTRDDGHYGVIEPPAQRRVGRPTGGI